MLLLRIQVRSHCLGLLAPVMGREHRRLEAGISALWEVLRGPSGLDLIGVEFEVGCRE